MKLCISISLDLGKDTQLSRLFLYSLIHLRRQWIKQARKACKSYFFGDRSLRRTVHSNDLVEFFWVAMYRKKETGNL